MGQSRDFDAGSLMSHDEKLFFKLVAKAKQRFVMEMLETVLVQASR